MIRLLWCLCRSLFGNVASLVMLDSTSDASISSIKDGGSGVVTGVQSVEGEVLQLTQPVNLIGCCVCVCVCVCARVCVCVCACTIRIFFTGHNIRECREVVILTSG